MVRKQAAQRYRDRVESRLALEGRRETNKDLPRDIYDVDDVFHTITQSDIDIAKARQAGKSKWIRKLVKWEGFKVWKSEKDWRSFQLEQQCLHKSPNRIHLYMIIFLTVACDVYVFINSRNVH